MQLAHALFSLGLMLGALGAGAARELGAERLPIFAAAAVALAAAAALNTGYARRPGGLPPRTRLRMRRPAVLFGLACAAAFVVEGGIEGWSALFAERELDAGPGAAALAPAAYALAMVVGRLSGQWLDLRLGDALLVGAGGVVSLAGLSIAALAPSLPVAVAGFFLGGLGVSVVAPAMFGAAGRTAAPEERASAVATATTLGYSGFLLGPPIVGALAETAGLRGAFALLAAAGGALALAAPRLGLEPLRREE
jgi:MFS family permease